MSCLNWATRFVFSELKLVEKSFFLCCGNGFENNLTVTALRNKKQINKNYL